MEKTVQHIIDLKGADVWSVDVATSVFGAIEFMAEKNIGAVIVTRDGALAGIMSERDYTRKIILQSRTSKETRVDEIMTAEPVTVDPSKTVTFCMQLMTENRFRHLPVVANGELVGLVSIGDIVLAVVDDQAFLIEQLAEYIRT